MLSELKDFALAHRTKGRGESFGFEDSTLETYLQWAYLKDYLLLVLQDGKVAGLAVVYPFKYDGAESLMSFNTGIRKDEEHKFDLCIMDVIALNAEALKKLILKFKIRFPHWDRVNKWAYRFGQPRQISNKYLNLL